MAAASRVLCVVKGVVDAAARTLNPTGPATGNPSGPCAERHGRRDFRRLLFLGFQYDNFNNVGMKLVVVENRTRGSSMGQANTRDHRGYLFRGLVLAASVEQHLPPFIHTFQPLNKLCHRHKFAILAHSSKEYP